MDHDWSTYPGHATYPHPKRFHKGSGQISSRPKTRPIFPKCWFSRGNPLISGKSRLVKYYNLARGLFIAGFIKGNQWVFRAALIIGPAISGGGWLTSHEWTACLYALFWGLVRYMGLIISCPVRVSYLWTCTFLYIYIYYIYICHIKYRQIHVFHHFDSIYFTNILYTQPKKIPWICCIRGSGGSMNSPNRGRKMDQEMRGGSPEGRKPSWAMKKTRLFRVYRGWNTTQLYFVIIS